MAYSRWANGNQVSYSGGHWYRFVIDREISGNTIKIRWGVESSTSLSDSTNKAWVQLNDNDGWTYTNKSISHPTGGAVTWFKTGTYTLSRGQSISADGYVENLADYAGGGGRSSVTQVSYTYPALPPNQMSAPTISNLKSTTATINWSAPSTNGASVTGYRVGYQKQDGSGHVSLDASASARSINISGLAPNTGYRARTAADSSAGTSEVSAWRNFTTPVAAPIAPGSPTVSRNSDTSHSLSWSRGSQTAGPYASQQVLRRTLANGVWGASSVIANVSATATSYVDTTTVANRAYQYQIRATNASGTATSGNSTVAWTTPGVPTNQKAAKNAAGDIVVSWAEPTSAANCVTLRSSLGASSSKSAATLNRSSNSGSSACSR